MFVRADLNVSDGAGPAAALAASCSLRGLAQPLGCAAVLSTPAAAPAARQGPWPRQCLAAQPAAPRPHPLALWGRGLGPPALPTPAPVDSHCSCCDAHTHTRTPSAGAPRRRPQHHRRHPHPRRRAHSQVPAGQRRQGGCWAKADEIGQGWAAAGRAAGCRLLGAGQLAAGQPGAARCQPILAGRHMPAACHQPWPSAERCSCRHATLAAQQMLTRRHASVTPGGLSGHQH